MISEIGVASGNTVDYEYELERDPFFLLSNEPVNTVSLCVLAVAQETKVHDM